MDAIRFDNHNNILAVNIPVPTPARGEALVKVLTAGICSTDIAIYHGYAGFNGIAGHEFAGIVENCPDQPGLEGKRVVADINFGCGQCIDEKHCPDRDVLGIRNHDGAFAKYCIVPVKNLYLVSEKIKTRHAVFAEPLAAALNISQQIHVTHQTRIGVVGDGCMGILSAITLGQYTAKAMLLGRHQDKIAIAQMQGVDTYRVDPDATPMEVRRQLGQFDITVDTTGNPQGINWCISLTRPRGTVVVKTTSTEKTMINLADIVVNELAIQGSRCGDMAFAMDFLEKERINVDPLIEAVYPFRQFEKAFSHAMKNTSLKILVDVSSD